MKLTIGDKSYEIEITEDGVSVDGQEFRTNVDGVGPTRIVHVNGRAIRLDFGAAAEAGTPIIAEGQTLVARIESGAGRPATRPTAARPAGSPRGAASGGGGAIKGAVAAQMTGRVVRVAIAVGDTIASGDLLLVLEAMKMENEIRSPRAGTVADVRVAAGDRVSQGDPLVVLSD